MIINDGIEYAKEYFCKNAITELMSVTRYGDATGIHDRVEYTNADSLTEEELKLIVNKLSEKALNNEQIQKAFKEIEYMIDDLII